MITRKNFLQSFLFVVASLLSIYYALYTTHKGTGIVGTGIVVSRSPPGRRTGERSAFKVVRILPAAAADNGRHGEAHAGEVYKVEK